MGIFISKIMCEAKREFLRGLGSSNQKILQAREVRIFSGTTHLRTCKIHTSENDLSS